MNADSILKNITPGASTDDAPSLDWTQKDDFKWFNATIKKNRDGEVIKKTIKFDYEEFTILLKKRGFVCQDLPDLKEEYLRLKDNIAERVVVKHMTRDIRKYVRGLELPHEDLTNKELLQKLITNNSNLFSSQQLVELHRDKPLRFNEDTPYFSYYYFNNGFVQIHKQEVKFKAFAELTKPIYKHEIHERPFNVQAPWTNGIFAKFINNVANNNDNKSPERFKSLCSILGYLLHKNVSGQGRAVIFTDGRISDDAEGRSGKGLITKGLMHFMNRDPKAKDDGALYVNVSGKDFKPDDKNKWQEATKDTKLIHLDDVDAFFDFEKLFVDIDYGVKVRKLYMSPFTIVPKIVLTTNKTIRTMGGSAQARVVEFELADYYTKDKTPDKEFGGWFFRDWDADEWARFDRFMVHCIQTYLHFGIIKVKSLVLEERKLREQTNDQFYDFMNRWYAKEIKVYHDDDEGDESKHYGFSWHDRTPKKALLDTFCRHHEDWESTRRNPRRNFSAQFTKWLRTWAFFHADFAKSNKEKDETSAGQHYYFTFRPSDEFRAQAKKEGKEIVEPTADTAQSSDAAATQEKEKDNTPPF